MKGIEHQKFRLNFHAGRKGDKRVFPKPSEFRKILDKINNFHDEHPDKIVVVHCTHGFNRTGYIICLFLFFHLGFTMTSALGTFSEVRQGGIYREQIVNEMYDIAADNDSEEDRSHPLPELPHWHHES